MTLRFVGPVGIGLLLLACGEAPGEERRFVSPSALSAPNRPPWQLRGRLIPPNSVFDLVIDDVEFTLSH